MEPVEVKIEKDKINDFKYIQDKVLNVCLQTLYELSKNTEEDFDNLAKKFLPVDDDKKRAIIEEFLSTIKPPTAVEAPVAPEVETKPLIKKKRKMKRKKKVKPPPLEQI